MSERPRDVSTAGKQGDADAFSGLSHEVAVGDYLHYSLSDTTLKGFEVMFSFQDSERVKVPINRHPRSRITSSDYFLEVPQRNAPLTEVAFTFNDDIPRAVELRICRSPALKMTNAD